MKKYLYFFSSNTRTNTAGSRAQSIELQAANSQTPDESGIVTIWQPTPGAPVPTQQTSIQPPHNGRQVYYRFNIESAPAHLPMPSPSMPADPPPSYSYTNRNNQ